MFRSGDMKLPVNKVEAIARVLKLDARDLLRRVLKEYSPDLLEALNSLMGQGGDIDMMTTHERNLLRFIRTHLGGRDLNLLADESLAADLANGIDALVDAANKGELEAHVERRRESQNMAFVQSMKDMLKRQAAEREELRASLWKRADPTP
jgi:hypothetical protein